VISRLIVVWRVHKAEEKPSDLNNQVLIFLTVLERNIYQWLKRTQSAIILLTHNTS